MAFDLDGLAVLASMASKPETFAGIEAEAAKIGRSLLTKLLKNKSTTLPIAQAMASALPVGTLAHVTDGMTDAEIATLATRFDRLNPTAKAADRQAKAELIGHLIFGTCEPIEQPVRAERAATQKRSAAKTTPSSGVAAATKVLNSKAMGARKAVKSSAP